MKDSLAQGNAALSDHLHNVEALVDQKTRSITFSWALDQDWIRIHLQDDGRGLQLDRMRSKAQKLGLSVSGPSNLELAHLIFAAGRGVGLAAVFGLRGMGSKAAVLPSFCCCRLR